MPVDPQAYTDFLLAQGTRTPLEVAEAKAGMYQEMYEAAIDVGTLNCENEEYARNLVLVPCTGADICYQGSFATGTTDLAFVGRGCTVTTVPEVDFLSMVAVSILCLCLVKHRIRKGHNAI